MMPIDWTTRWLGGMCPAGVLDGLPIRGRTYAPSTPLCEQLRLPPTKEFEQAANSSVHAIWSAAMHHAPVLLVRSLNRARQLVLEGLGATAGTAVLVPATASRALVENLKASGARPVFGGLDDRLALIVEQPGDCIVWEQTLAGWHAGHRFSGSDGLAGVPSVFENPDTIPGDTRAARRVEIHALHLGLDPEQAGALLVIHDAALAQALKTLFRPEDGVDPGAALAQFWRLADLSRRQLLQLSEVHRGLAEAAGLDLLPLPRVTLPRGVAVQIPPEADAATFHAYVKAENTPVYWLPELCPIHYAAARQGLDYLDTARRLARWLLIPVGPDDSPAEIAHAVLGVVKAADYLGVRWRCDPVRAAAYARLMDEWYGPDHDAYRPIFSTAGPCPMTPALTPSQPWAP